MGSGLALQVQQKQREKQFSKQIPAAARLIQCMWRVFVTSSDTSFSVWDSSTILGVTASAEPQQNSVSDSATWRLFDRQFEHTMRTCTACPEHALVSTSFAQGVNSFAGIFFNQNASSEKRNGSRRSEQPEITASEFANEYYNTNKYRWVRKRMSSSNEGNLQTTHANPSSRAQRCRSSHSWIDGSLGSTFHLQHAAQTECVHKFRLNSEQRFLFRCVLKMKLLVARRAFLESRKSTDMRILLEQNSLGYTQLSMRLKEIMRRLDQLIGKPVSLPTQPTQTLHAQFNYQGSTHSAIQTPTIHVTPAESFPATETVSDTAVPVQKSQPAENELCSILQPSKFSSEKATEPASSEKSRIWRTRSVLCEKVPVQKASDTANVSRSGGLLRAVSSRRSGLSRPADRQALTLFSRVAALESQVQSVNLKMDRVLSILDPREEHHN